jgi:hypothetical protein
VQADLADVAPPAHRTGAHRNALRAQAFRSHTCASAVTLATFVRRVSASQRIALECISNGSWTVGRSGGERMGMAVRIHVCDRVGCGWTGIEAKYGCPQCFSPTRVIAYDQELEQKALVRDSVAIMGTIQAKRQRLGEARIAHRQAIEQEHRARRWVEECRQRPWDTAPEVHQAQQTLLRAERRRAEAQLRVSEAEAAAGVWGGRHLHA